MITKEHRFHGRGSLRFVYTRGQIVRGQDINLRFAHNNQREEYRMAVVVSRKVSKSAVVRNRIRRRVYEIVRLAAQDIVRPYDLVFLVYSDVAAQLPHARLQQTVHLLLHKARVLETAGSQASANRSGHAILEPKETNI